MIQIRVTANYDDTFAIILIGISTNAYQDETFSSPVTNYLIETKYISDGTTTGDLRIIYSTTTPNLEFPTYILYFNKSGFVGWWWILLSAIGVLALVIVLLTFAIIGMVSVSRNGMSKKKNKRKRKK